MTRKNAPLPILPLTPKEKAFLEFIERRLLSSGVCPSYQEIMDHFGLASFNSVQNYLKQLSQKGYVQIIPHQKRAIQILQSSTALSEALSSKISTKRGPSRSQLLQARGEALSLPLLGRVAAGQPIERLEHNERVDVPLHLVKREADTFALRVEGDSMIDDGIWDGDLILVESRKTASNGDIVVATVDSEATIKRFYLHRTGGPHKDGPEVELRPSNPRLKPMWYKPDQVEIRGILVGLLRKY